MEISIDFSQKKNLKITIPSTLFPKKTASLYQKIFFFHISHKSIFRFSSPPAAAEIQTPYLRISRHLLLPSIQVTTHQTHPVRAAQKLEEKIRYPIGEKKKKKNFFFASLNFFFLIENFFLFIYCRDDKHAIWNYIEKKDWNKLKKKLSNKRFIEEISRIVDEDGKV